MIRRPRERRVPAGRARIRNARQFGVEAIEARLLLDGAAVAAFVPPQPPVNLAAPPPVVTAAGRFGFHDAPAVLVVQFSQPMNRTFAQRAGNYLLETPGADGRFDDSANLPVGIALAGYDAARQTVILVPARRISLHQPVRLTVNGDLAGLANAAGTPLDGDFDGRPGGSFTAIIQGFTASPVRPSPPHPIAASLPRGRGPAFLFAADRDPGPAPSPARPGLALAAQRPGAVSV